jgi:exodeoxyribonuclease VII small subunit
MAKKDELTYEKAAAELNEIVARLENEEVSVDDLTENMKRASFLVQFCTGKLRDTELSVQKIIREMEEAGPIAPDDKDEPF